MKQTKLLLLTFLSALLCPFVMRGATVSSYTVDFNTTIDTSDHGFKVAKNWKHIVDKYVEYSNTYYVDYSWASTTGVAGGDGSSSGALSVGWQGCQITDESDYYGSYIDQDLYDLLVTPKVSGTITLQVKKTSSYNYWNSKTYVEFYSLNETATAKDKLLKKIPSSDLSASEFTTVSLDLSEAGITTPQCIGIRASRVYIDNFTATSAEIEPEQAIKILTAEPSQTSGTLFWDEQPDKKVIVTFTGITVENTGDVDLVKYEDNFSISLINSKNGEDVSTPVAVPENLIKGATSQPFEAVFEISAEKSKEIWSSSQASANLWLRENLQGTTVARAQSMKNAYESKFYLKEAGVSSNISKNSVQDFGLASDAVTKTYIIGNEGVAPLHIKNVVLPEGYTSDLDKTEFTLTKNETKEFAVTMNKEPYGVHNGTFTITFVNNNDQDETYPLEFKGTTIAEGTWTADFNHDPSTPNSSANFPVGSIAESGISSSYQGGYPNYNPNLTSYNWASSDNNKFITPLLHANAGDIMTFDVARDNSSDASNITVYTSTDRRNWTQVGEPIKRADITSYNGFENKSITFPSEGNFYVAFAIKGMKLDNIVGLKAVEGIAHDIFIVEVSQKDEIQSGKELSSSIDIISPLEDLAADAYTVKFYVNGEAVKTIDSKALSLSAKSKTTFNLTGYVPTVEHTVTYPTYYEIKFTDGTTYKSDVKNLKITNEPYFCFVNGDSSDSPTAYNPPTSRKTAIDFGITNDNTVKQSFKVINWGTAPLEVTSIAVPEGFTVSETGFTVPGKDIKRFDIAFSTEVPGNYSGELTVKYKDGTGAEQTFTLPVSGTMLDPNKWYAPFDKADKSAGEYPAGSITTGSFEIQNKGTNTDPEYALNTYDSKYLESMFITPKLKAEANEAITFYAKLYSASNTGGGVDVYAAATREDLADASKRTLLGSWCGDNEEDAEQHTAKLTADFTQYAATIAEAGEYYIGFHVYSRAYLDNVYGLSLVDVAHDVKITGSSVPESGMQNQPLSALLTLNNIGLKEEAADSYTITPYIDGVKMTGFTGPVLPAVNSLKSSFGANVEVPFQSPKPGTLPVYFTVDFGDDYVLTTESVEVTFAEEVASSEHVVGEIDNTKTGSWSGLGTPLHPYYKNSESVLLYTPDMLGLTGGEKISSITFKGWNDQTNVIKNSHVQVYYEWTDNKSQTSPSSATFDTAGMTKCLDNPSYTWTLEGTKTAHADIITISFNEPIEYPQGKSLRLFLSAVQDNYCKYYFEVTNDQTNNFYHSNDNSLPASWSRSYLPVMYLGLEVEPTTYTATVENKDNQAVEGATVTLTSTDGDNVQYEGTTDATGKCVIKVIQNTREYNATATAAAGEAYHDNVSFAAGSVEETLKLLPVIEINDEYSHDIESAQNCHVIISTVFDKSFNTVALPVQLSADEVKQVFGDDVKVLDYVYDKLVDNTVTITFQEVTDGMTAGKPYLLYLSQPTKTVKLRNKWAVAKTTFGAIDSPNVIFTPTLSTTTLPENAFVPTAWEYVPNIPKARAKGNTSLKACRAYFVPTDPQANYNYEFDTQAYIETGIEDVDAEAEKSEDVIYNLQGIRVSEPIKGQIYIINGKKTVVK